MSSEPATNPLSLSLLNPPPLVGSQPGDVQREREEEDRGGGLAAGRGPYYSAQSRGGSQVKSLRRQQLLLHLLRLPHFSCGCILLRGEIGLSLLRIRRGPLTFDRCGGIIRIAVRREIGRECPQRKFCTKGDSLLCESLHTLPPFPPRPSSILLAACMQIPILFAEREGEREVVSSSSSFYVERENSLVTSFTQRTTHFPISCGLESTLQKWKTRLLLSKKRNTYSSLLSLLDQFRNPVSATDREGQRRKRAERREREERQENPPTYLLPSFP